MPLDLQRPAFKRGLAFPKQFAVTMDVLAARIVFRRIIAQESQVDEVSGGGEKFEGREIPFVERTGVGPNPADAIFFEQPNVLRPVPVTAWFD